MQKTCRGCGQPLLPVPIRGEGAGRRMRGGTDIDNWSVERQFCLQRLSRGMNGPVLLMTYMHAMFGLPLFFSIG
ncbi:hypothetical protein CIT25_30850 [Mesorhizobium mediterraneum]|uniref:Uncharacterized protein n=1 Tax=Mesorhizobium mediterraneum TaxID=43617 RepID=A0AB36R0K5_9HYPH|nr:hypothetical protein CIT25_30850 [Mesorhizobium mediterraneum]